MGLFRRSKTVVPSRVLTASAAPPSRPVSPGQHRAQAANWKAIRTITASAAQVNVNKMQPGKKPYSDWQAEAWTGFEKVGEIHYGFSLVANIMSRVRIYAGAVIGPEQSPMLAKEAAEKDLLNSELAQMATDAMDDLTADDFPVMVRSFSLNTSVAGESYLIHLPDPADPEHPDAEPDKHWTIRSGDELEFRAGQVVLNPMRGSTSEQQMLPKDTFIARIWRSSARYSMEPDSSMLGISDPIEELLLLQRLVRSTTRSRLNMGVVFMPDGVTVATPTVSEDPDAEVEDPGNEFLAQFIDAMVTPIEDEGNASSVVPLVVTGPEGLGEKIKHITFERSSDEWLVNRSERALERILQGLDVPKEIVTGLAQVKYANAIVIDENLYRANIEPLCLMLADSLTQVYLRPVLRARGVPEADLQRVCVWYDPSEIVTRPNQAQDATDGFDRYIVSPATWRREHGFSDTDAPTEAELAFMLLTQKGVLPDEVTSSLLQVVLPDTLGKKREENISNSVIPFPTSAQKLLAPPGDKADQVKDAAVGENAR